MRKMYNHLFHKGDVILIFCAILLFIGAYAVLSGRTQSDLINEHHPKVTRTMIKKDKHKKQTYNFSKVKPVTTTSVLQARAHDKNVAVAGQMLVPSVGLHLPIDLGTSNASLLLGAGTMRANMKMGQGNYAMAGHHMYNSSPISHKVLFSPLYDKAHDGTKVYLTNDKNVYVYQINERKIISPYDVGVVNDTRNPIITLITCNDSGSKRLLLRGNLIKTESIKQAPNALVKDINSDTNNHNVLAGY